MDAMIPVFTMTLPTQRSLKDKRFMQMNRIYLYSWWQWANIRCNMLLWRSWNGR